MSESMPPTDGFGRRIDYLRISVTERCDLRCAYCYPRLCTDSSPQDVLSAEEVVAIGAGGVRLGLRRIRLTGGEPLLRPDLEGMISRLRALPGLQDLSLTTNGQKLAGRAASLASAGLMRVNVSLDSLDPEVYAAITSGGEVGAVRRGLDAALAAGLSPVKVNVVVSSPAGLARAGVGALVDLVEREPIHVRFIEAMPTCSQAGYLPGEGVLDFLRHRYELARALGPEGGGPAEYYRLNGSRGTVGLITPISQPFCDRCNRLRVSARGELRPCLFSKNALDVLPAVRSGDPVGEVSSVLRQGIAAKPRRYGEIAEPSGIPAMHVIGG